MNGIIVSKHARTRISQRGIEERDLDLIMLIGTEVDDGYWVRDRDVRAFERKLKELLNRALRLKGKRIVVADGTLVTAFHTQGPEEKRLLRSGRRSLDEAL
jgi:hypothetical protein